MTKPLKVRLEEVQLGDSVFHPMIEGVEYRVRTITWSSKGYGLVYHCDAYSDDGECFTFQPHEMRRADGSEVMVRDGKLLWVIVEPGELYSVRLEDIQEGDLFNINGYLPPPPTPTTVSLYQIGVTEDDYCKIDTPYGETYVFAPHEAERLDGSQLLLCDDGALRWIVIEPAEEDDDPEMLFDEDGNQCMGVFIDGELKRVG